MGYQTEKIKNFALEIGFDAVGITRFEKLQKGESVLMHWIGQGKHAGMKYLEDFKKRKSDFLQDFDGKEKSILVLGVNYFVKEPLENSKDKLGRVARYAWGQDYHRVIANKHQLLIAQIQQEFGADIQAKSCVDTQPIPERSAAIESGLGFGGKHTNLLNAHFGPWLFLSEIVLNVDLEETVATGGNCGTCSICQSRCPTGALNRDYELDAKLCIAYWTIEHKGVIPREIRPLIGNWIFGCDECLAVCPFTSKSKETTWTEFKVTGKSGPYLNISELFDIVSNSEFEKRFRGTAISRVNRKQMLRNACIVLGNSKKLESIALLEKGLQDSSELVRLHAAWALGQIRSRDAAHLLQSAFEREVNPDVKEELAQALQLF